MSAGGAAFAALTSDRAMSPGDAVKLLAVLRQEMGEDLAAAIEKRLDGQFRRTGTDTENTFRRKKVVFAASMRVVQAVRDLTRVPRT
ncbi:hypothetical protein ACFU3O_01890 [Streptomyces antibioticus]|uniref:hypothetical protein n=1 Tax=Streptomyces antibioticus TaxID=1890 RepID=UPI0036C3074C